MSRDLSLSVPASAYSVMSLNMFETFYIFVFSASVGIGIWGRKINKRRLYIDTGSIIVFLIIK